MPVLSERTSVPVYIFLGCAVALLCFLLRRKSQIQNSRTMSRTPSPKSSEKRERELAQTTTEQQSHQPSPGARIQRPSPQPPPYRDFPPPAGSSVGANAIFANQTFSPQENASFTSSPTTYTNPPQFPPFPLPTSKSYDSSTMPPASEIPFNQEPPTNQSFSIEVEIPRRRSYTKTTSQGAEVSGQVEIGESWRRHTRVFGGGVCKACEESEERRRMSA